MAFISFPNNVLMNYIHANSGIHLVAHAPNSLEF